jgi:hypothetical protein
LRDRRLLRAERGAEDGRRGEIEEIKGGGFSTTYNFIALSF